MWLRHRTKRTDLRSQQHGCRAAVWICPLRTEFLRQYGTQSVKRKWASGGIIRTATFTGSSYWLTFDDALQVEND